MKKKKKQRAEATFPADRREKWVCPRCHRRADGPACWLCGGGKTIRRSR